ncbi:MULTISPECIES: GTP pyrophosphokinase family protein [unclassified Cobetia]|uniref:GTP pyrophosphokinase n=1 Tax=unclassified Cobetia TaxID=2609414 RepID=UPI002096871D|nr:MULTISPECIES: hypothetical protein [unclassified Cobetia]MCO7233959.1 hypothetical protein [Cobetia sp. Dlab-2-AX]MCO7237151.1 hypothetical protein [Cobetia sp. Dlab-2-U]
MSARDYDKVKSRFKDYYNENFTLLNDAEISFRTLTSSLIRSDSSIAISKVEGRVKNRDECIKKFSRKYRDALELDEKDYDILDHITDLIGIRIVCLYEDDIEKIKCILCEHFDVIEITDKISEIESTENSFGYKGLHLDLKLNNDRAKLPEYKSFSGFSFEVQIRTIIQDSWSVLDHKIKYKKSIPNSLKRRINSLAALFEVADREFREIRNATDENMKAENELTEEQIAEESGNFVADHNCRVPDDRISQRSYPLLASRELIKQLIQEKLHGHQAA